MLTSIALVLIGISLLIWSADRFTDGAAAIAQNFGVPRVVIGLTVVAIGSSAPELFVSATDSLEGTHGLAIGNALGSNIANIALVLAVTCLLHPLRVKSSILAREIPLMVALSGFSAALMWDGTLSRSDGILLLIILVLYLVWIARSGLQGRHRDPMVAEVIGELPATMSNVKSIFWVIVGLVFLLLSSEILVSSAKAIAIHLGVSDVVIGLTVVAIGTSLPELAASIAGVMKNEHDMVLGNIIGSNIFNLLGVVGIAGVLAPQPVPASVINRDIPVMFAISVAFYLLAHGFGRGAKVGRLEAGVLLASYFAYATWIFMSHY